MQGSEELQSTAVYRTSGVTEGERRVERGRRTDPDDTLQWMTPEGKKIVGNFTKNSGQNEVGQVKKGAGDTLQGGGETRVKSIKSYSDEQKRSSVFQKKINRGDTA